MDVAGALREDVSVGRSEGRSGALVVWRERAASGEASVRRRGRRNVRNMVAVGWGCVGGLVVRLGGKSAKSARAVGVWCRAEGRIEGRGFRC